jgi:hypothetical protein
MKLIDIIKPIAEAYDPADPHILLQFFTEDGALLSHAALKRLQAGDTLAEFIAIEVSETYDAEGTNEEQTAEAARVLESAAAQLAAAAQAARDLAPGPATS